MASSSSNDWEIALKEGNLDRIGAPEIDGALLTALLEESHVAGEEGEAIDEKLGFVIQSLEAEIDMDNGRAIGSMVPESGNYYNYADRGFGTVGLDGVHDCSVSSYHVEDPFDWVDMEMVRGPSGADMGNWYWDTCTNEIGMVHFGDVMDYAAVYDGDVSIEHEYIPLWQET
eukprot:TRINITY_DN27048_c0_g1_i1.p1 TRINITY_DN27048_c0_g1~~TRINITY_DN27048_c0_g1_i1.p1  ORF type:complete len:196 (+),score=30.05 TRINITY_DN27048_c0_g1_i1:75-590(+)